MIAIRLRSRVWVSPWDSCLGVQSGLPTGHDALERLDPVIDVFIDGFALLFGKTEGRVDALARGQLPFAEGTPFFGPEQFVEFATRASAVAASVIDHWRQLIRGPEPRSVTALARE